MEDYVKKLNGEEGTVTVEKDGRKIVLTVGLLGDVRVKKKKENIRLIKLVDEIDKEIWYSKCKGLVMKAYLFPKHVDALSVTFPDSTVISGEHFDLVKYWDHARNDDIRLK